MRNALGKILLAVQNFGSRVALAVLVTVVATVAAPRDASAAGSVQMANREPQEEEGKWKLKFVIDNGTPPVLPHFSVLFVFTPTVLYERALTDKTGDKPVINRIPLRNQQAITESLDVGFSDPMGKIFAKTSYDFVIRRDRGFEAGEYDLKLKREGDGVQLGQTIKLVLKGDNPIVDRRAIVFSGEKNKKVKDDKGAAAASATPSAEPKAADPPAAPPEGAPPAEGGGEPPPVEPKQGGCGCRVAGEPDHGPLGLVLTLAAAGAVAARRRRVSARRG